jgi:hypothetical protein
MVTRNLARDPLVHDATTALAVFGHLEDPRRGVRPDSSEHPCYWSRSCGEVVFQGIPALPDRGYLHHVAIYANDACDDRLRPLVTIRAH